MHWLALRAVNRGFDTLLGFIIESERNEPARSVFRDSGFEPGANPKEWILNLRNTPPRIPPWVVFDPKENEEEFKK